MIVTDKMSAPYRLRGSKEWALAFDGSEAIRSRVVGIPALRASNHELIGKIDAIAAACLALNRPAPTSGIQLNNVNLRLEGLREYQQVGVAMLAAISSNSGGAILGDDMGLGKTRQAVAFAQEKKCKKVFILCPASVRETWRKELIELGVKQTAIAILGPRSDRFYREDWQRAEKANWIVASYNQVDPSFEALGYCFPDLLILDEGHLLRTRSKSAPVVGAVERIAQMCTRKLLLSGTPFWDRPRDGYRILRILFGNTFGTATQFDERYCGGQVGDNGAWQNKGSTNHEEFRTRLSYYMVRRLKSEVAKELPALTRQVAWVDEDSAATGAFQSAAFNKTPGGTYTAIEATLDAKKQRAIELAQEARQFVLFTWRKKDAYELAQELNVSCITGETPPRKRMELIEEAKQARRGLVATIDSTGTGVDGLQHVASVAIFHALDYVPQKLLQAEKRLDRIGQREPVMVYYVALRGSIDQRIVSIVVEKLGQVGAVVSGDQGLSHTLGYDATGSEESALRRIYEEM